MILKKPKKPRLYLTLIIKLIEIILFILQKSIYYLKN